jgi:hypothetical protein
LHTNEGNVPACRATDGGLLPVPDLLAKSATLTVGGSSTTTATIARVPRTCGYIKSHWYEGKPVLVTVFKGKASCAEARKIASKFQGRDRGLFHGQNLASGYWIVDGWKCQSGTDGGSGCTHGEGSTITMQAELPPTEEACGTATVASTVVNGQVASGWDDFHVKGTSCQIALGVMRLFEAEHLTVDDHVDGWTFSIRHYELTGHKGTASFYCDAFGVD